MAKKKSVMAKAHLLGSWAFLVGFIFALVLGLGFAGAYRATLVWVVFLAGVVVGLLNVGGKEETKAFLSAGTVLVLVSFLGVQVGTFEGIAPVISDVLKGILALFVPATIIVAIRSVFAIARD
jgi:hypothetical protein